MPSECPSLGGRGYRDRVLAVSLLWPRSSHAKKLYAAACIHRKPKEAEIFIPLHRRYIPISAFWGRNFRTFMALFYPTTYGKKKFMHIILRCRSHRQWLTLLVGSFVFYCVTNWFMYYFTPFVKKAMINIRVIIG